MVVMEFLRFSQLRINLTLSSLYSFNQILQLLVLLKSLCLNIEPSFFIFAVFDILKYCLKIMIIQKLDDLFI